MLFVYSVEDIIGVIILLAVLLLLLAVVIENRIRKR